MRVNKTTALIIIVIVGAALYYPVVTYDFVWDDRMDDLLTNPGLRDVNLQSMLNIWKLSYWDKYIPVTFTVRALLKLAGGNNFNASIYHLFSLLLHILNSLLVFVVLKKIIKFDLASLTGALLFLIHPFQVESVAWITANEVLLSSFFGLISFYYYLNFSEKTQTKYYILSALAYAFSILSRPSLIALPLIFLFYDWFYNKRNFMKSMIRQIPFLLFLIPGAIIQILNQPGVKVEIYSPLWVRPLVWFDNLGFYLSRLVFPYNLRPAYGRVTEWLLSNWQFYFSIAFTLILSYLVIKIRKIEPVIVMGLVIFIVAMLPVSGFLPFVFQKWSNVADRYVYFSMLGVSLVSGMIFVRYKMGRYTIYPILVLFLLITRIHQLPVWKNDLELWHRNADSSGRLSALSLNNLGNAQLRTGNFKEAAGNFSKAIEIEPEYSAAFNNRGLCYFQMNKLQKAEDDYRRALDIEPDYYLANYNLGRIYLKKKDNRKAEHYLLRAVRFRSGFAPAYGDLGLLYAREGNWKKSDYHFQRALRLLPDDSAIYNNLGLKAELKGNKDKALEFYTKAVECDPENLNAYNNRANLHYLSKDFQLALQDFDTMVTKDSLYLEAFYNRGTVLLELGNYESAVMDFSYVIQNDSLFTDAWLNRSLAYYNLRRLENALSDADHYIDLGGELHEGYLEALAVALKTSIDLEMKSENQ